MEEQKERAREGGSQGGDARRCKEDLAAMQSRQSMQGMENG